jgi:hypothetical protein
MLTTIPKPMLVCGLLALLGAMPLATATADPWKNESGHGRREREYRADRDRGHRDDRRDERWQGDRRDWDHRGGWDQRRDGERRGDPDDRRGYGYAPPPIPRGHLPPPGEVRPWFPDRPAGHQPPPGRW